MAGIVQALIAIWTGSLLTACAVVAPAAFAVLDSKETAGKITGAVFRSQGWIGLGLLVLIGFAWWKQPNRPSGALYPILLVLLTLAPWVGAVALTPAMDHAKAASNMKLFGMLHGVSSLLFVAACCAGLALIWLLNRRAG